MSVYMASSLTLLAPSFDVPTRDDRVRLFVQTQRIFASGDDFAFVGLCAVYKDATIWAAAGLWGKRAERCFRSETIVFV